MSLIDTLHTRHWNSIAKRCKNCSKAIYTVESGEIIYQCSIWGSFKRDCDLITVIQQLKKPEEILAQLSKDKPNI